MKLLKVFFVLAICCLATLSCTRDFRSNNDRFEPEKWKTHEMRARGQMTKNLLDQNILVGKLPDEVRELLGDPENIDHSGTFEYQTDPGAWLGGANNGPWIHYLHVEYAKADGRATRAYMTD